MSTDANQVYVPESYQALFQERGRLSMPRRELEARHEFCEDLAQQVAELCQAMQFKRELSHNEALVTCRNGLLAAATVTEAESAWVMRRVVEILGWRVPDWLVTPFDARRGRAIEPGSSAPENPAAGAADRPA